MIRRLWYRLFPLRPPDCLTCGRRFTQWPMLGSWWHADGCPEARHDRDDIGDDEE